MSDQCLEDAIEKISTDLNYQKAVSINPELLIMDYQLSDEQLEALKNAGKVSHKISEVRPTAFCCTCVAPDRG